MQSNFIALALAAGLFALILPGGTPQAATFVVTHFSDPTPTNCLRSCSLREAVMAANSQPGPHVIVLQAGTYRLTNLGPTNNPQASGPLSSRQSISISGVGPDQTRIRWDVKGDHENPVFLLQNSTLTSMSLTLSQLSVSHGRGPFGGCLESRAVPSLPNHVQLADARFTACQTSGSGGAMQLRATHLAAVRSSFDKNLATANGGAMMLMGDLDVVTEKTDWSNNHAGLDGGAVSIHGHGMVGWTSRVNWVDQGGSRIVNNSAGRHGGGIAFSGAGEIDLRTVSGLASTNFLTIDGNSAERGGGIDLDYSPMAVHAHSHRIRRVRLSDNVADSGGGLASNFAVSISDSQINDNTASDGFGGGVFLHGQVEWINGRHLDRISLFGNSASKAGGAIYSGCPSLFASDLSLTANTAGGGGAQAIRIDGIAQLRHITASGNGAQGAGIEAVRGGDTGCFGAETVIENSVVTDACSALIDLTPISFGGNVWAATASNCPADTEDLNAIPVGELGLQFSSWNGSFPVLGWLLSSPPAPQQGFGLSQHCSTMDVRGQQRLPWACDAGAFQAVD